MCEHTWCDDIKFFRSHHGIIEKDEVTSHEPTLNIHANIQVMVVSLLHNE